MRHSWVCGFAASLSLTVVCSAWAGDDANAILKKAIAARGGEKGLAKEKNLAWKAKGTMHLFGMKNVYDAQYWFAAPDKMAFKMKANFGGMDVELTAGTDGKTAWEKMGDMIREMEKDKAEEFQHTVYAMYVSSLVPLTEKGFTLNALEETKVEGKPAVGVKVSKKGKRDVSLYFDKESNLLVKSVTRTFDEFVKKEVTQEVLFSGYRDMDGAKVFDRLTIRREGMPFIEETMSAQRALEKADEKMFKMPAK